MQGHDIIVIGGSTGGIEALKRLVADFPPEMPAAVFVVIHTAPGSESFLPQVLSHAGPLRASLAIHGEPISNGHIYVAPPDNHILVRTGYIAVQRGPKENGHRPAVDPLFRSAAVAYGPRVIAALLSGHLDCGTAGLLSIKARGGISIVQAPSDALVQEMPRSAITHATVDHVVPVAEMGALITRLAHQPVTPRASKESDIALLEVEGDEPGVASNVVCPICQGSLTEGQLDKVTSFRCHVGHAFSSVGLLAEQAESLERALWAAVRTLEESATLSKRMAITDRMLRARFEEKAQTQTQQADVLRQMLLGAGGLDVTDAETVALARSPRRMPRKKNKRSRQETKPPANAASTKRHSASKANGSIRTKTEARRSITPKRRNAPGEGH
jgi:two-component system chemotaxis response regulator CheB